MAQSSDLTHTFPTLQRRSSRYFDPPNFRIVLLGKDASANSRVGNFMLGRSAFESQARPDDDDYHSERVRGKSMTLINCPHLLQPNLSYHHIIQTVRECVRMSDPGPHVIILVLQNHDFTEIDRNRVKHRLNRFSDQAIKRTILLTIDDELHHQFTYIDTVVMMNQYIIDLMKVCGGGHLQFDERQADCHAEIFRKIDEIVQKEPDEYLKCETPPSSPSSSRSVQECSSVTSQEEDSCLRDDDKHTESHQRRTDEGNVQISLPSASASALVDGKPKLNVVLCGTDARLKSTISKLLRGKIKTALNQKSEFSSVCVKKERHLMNVVELPALSRLSDEDVMNQTLTAVSLCHPGVHAFLIIVPVGPLTDEDKEEVKKIQKIFYSSERFMVIFTTDVTVDRNVMDFVESYAECQRLIRLCAGRHKVLGFKDHDKLKLISKDLLDYIKDMKTEPYLLHMYVRSQEKKVRHETEEKYEEKLIEMTNKIKDLQSKIDSCGVEVGQEDVKGLRIVLIGKTGNGKSATGNTILGSRKFKSLASTDSVTTVCVKRVGETDGRSVAVVDTPGLFDTTLSNEQIQDEIVKCVSLSSPGPHVFIIVLCVGRFTQEESDTIDMIRMFFGPKVAQFSIVLFTNGDKLQNEPIEHFINRSNNRELKKLLRDCGNRFLAFSNNETQDRTQVTRLINTIDDLTSSNQGRYFTNSMFEEAEMSIQKNMEKILKEKEREIQTQKEELKAKHEIEMEKMKKKLEEEKRKTDEERLKIESTFKEKEETLRKDYEEKEKSEQEKQEKERQKRLEEEQNQKAEYHQKIEEMKRKIEDQRLLYEQQQKEKEEEERKKEEKYRHDQEKMKHEQEQIIAELQKRQDEETKKRELDEEKRNDQEERIREEWARKIKDAENDRKETREEIKRQQREWEEKMKQQLKEREEDERKRKEGHNEQLREKQEELEEMRNTFEMEREEKRQQREDERQKQRQEREEKEREHEEKKNEMMKHYEKLERERKKLWEKKKQEDEERREEERKRWEKRIDDIKREQEKEIQRREIQEKERKESEEKQRREIKKEHERRIKEMKKNHEAEARKHAEEFNEFRERKEQHVQELQETLEEHQKQRDILEKLYQYLKTQKGKEMEDLQKAVEKLRNKSSCAIM